MEIEKRKNQVDTVEIAEEILWQNIKNGKLGGKKFIRKHKIDDFTIDFYCPNEKLAIIFEQIHFSNSILAEYYKRKEIHLSKYGIRVFKFDTKDVLYSLKSVMHKISKSFFYE